jgi:hypothetical protein
MVMWLII